MQSCYQCGAEAALDDQFCGNCGIAQPVPPPLAEETNKRRILIPVQAVASEPIWAEPVLSEPSAAASGDSSYKPSAEAAPAIADFELVNEDTDTQEELQDTINEADFQELFAPAENEPKVTSSEAVSVNSNLSSAEVEGDKSSEALQNFPEISHPAPVVSKEIESALPPEDQEGLQETMNSPPAARSRSAKSSGSTSSAYRTGHGAERRASPKTLESGVILNGRYEIVRRIGGGGMGAVYLAKDRNLGDAPRAVKEMIQSQMDEAQQEKAVGDFKRESLLLTSLEHSSIPTIYDYFYDEQAGRFYLVMRYISGGDLLSRLRNAPGGRIDEKTVAAWGIEVADVLNYLHSRRPPIIYRDLKPANLMIDGNSGRIMLIDFGIARWVGGQEKGVTAVGTMGYAPPELFSGKVEPRSDIYSLGATMFHLLTGSDPQDNPLLIFDFTKHPKPRQINPSLSNEIERLLMRAVEYKPEDRFASVGVMRDALVQHLKDLSTGKVSYGEAAADRPVGQTVAVEMVFCGFCGGRIAAADMFCAYCGARQPLAGSASAALQHAARTTAKLVVASTTELNASFALQKESNLVGRSDPNSNIFPEIDLSKFDPHTKVSRRHARIWREGDAFLVEDLGSINGTVINDAVRLAPRQPRVLESGDKLRLGETTLHFLVG